MLVCGWKHMRNERGNMEWKGDTEFARRNCNQLDKILVSGSRMFVKFSLTLENKILVLY
jgi:hypothetical protein